MIKNLPPILNKIPDSLYITLRNLFLLLYLISLPAKQANAAISDPVPGTSLNTAAILSGAYTVGVGGDYLTITEAVNDYNTQIINGPVVFLLISANYNSSETFPILINNNAGASVNNTLTIKPAAGITASVTGTINNDALIKILGSYVIIDGSNNGSGSRDLSFANLGPTLARTVLFGSTGTSPVVNSTIKNCNVIGGTSSSNAIIISDGAIVNSPGYFNNITIENNSIRKSFYGVYCNAVAATGNGSGLLIKDNDLSGTGANAIQFTGIFVQGVDGASVRFNNIGNFVSTDAATDCGISIITGSRNVEVLGNTITNLTYTGGAGFGSRGIYVNTGLTNANILLSGNMIANITGDGDDYTNSGVTLNNPAGILMIGPQTGIRIYHNSIFLGGVSGSTNTLNKTNAISTGIRIYGSGSADVRNNILINNLGLAGATGYGSVGLMASNSTAQFTSLNYNDYIVNPTGGGARVFGFVAGTAYSTLSAWKTATGKDAASFSAAPVFISPTNLHLVPGSNALLSNAAAAIAGYTENDIDNATRNPVTPDIGCDEFVEPNTGMWIGKTSTAWATATNWEANAIPDGTTDVTIGAGYPNLPVIAGTHSVRGLILSGSGTATLITLENSKLQVSGAIIRNAGCIDASAGTIEMNGTVLQNIPAGLFVSNHLKSLVISNTDGISGVILNGPLDIYQSVTFSNSGLKLTTNDFLTFKSTASETAWLGNVTGKTIAGNATIERYIPTGINHGKSWQLLAAPIRGNQSIFASWQEFNSPLGNSKPGYGTTISSEKLNAVSRGYDFYTPSGPSIKTYDPSTNSYVGVDNGSDATAAVSISNQKGYLVLVRGDRGVQTSSASATPTVLRTTGGLHTATAGQLPPVTTVPANKFITIGNPYPSAIDFTAVSRTAGVDNVFYVWDPLLEGSNLLGGYQTISAVAGFLPTPGSVNYPANVPVTGIQSGQAFYVHGSAGGTITFTEDAKISGSRLVLRQEATQRIISMLRVSLFKTTAMQLGAADGNSIALNSDYSNGFDENDALKISHGDESFGILSNEKILAIEARQPFTENDTVYYQMSNLRQQAYRLKFTAMNISSPGLTAWLVDRYLGVVTEISLSDSSIANFSVSSDPGSAANNRFCLVFKKLEILPVTFTHISVTRTPDMQNRVNWKLENETGMQHYEIERSREGRSFEKLAVTVPLYNNGASASYTYLDRTPLVTDNFYRVKAFSNSGQIHYSAIVKVSSAREESPISVYPNPLINKLLSISFVNQETGVYQLQLVNAVGQVFLKRSIEIANGNETRSIPLANTTATGTYRLILTSPSGKVTANQIIVE